MTTSRRSRQTSFVDGSESEPVMTWPTPNSRDHKGAPGAGCRERGGHQASLPAAVKDRLWQTPTGNDKRPVGPVEREIAERWAAGETPATTYQRLRIQVLARGCSPPATPASRSATPGSGPERTTPGTSGRGFETSLPASTPTVLRGFASRMFAATSGWGSTVCSLTWTTSATPQRRGLYLLRASVRSTGGTGSGSSDAEPTPAGGLFQSPMPSDVTGGRTTKGSRRQAETGLRQQAMAVEAARMWPTPTAETSERSKPYAQGGKSLAFQAAQLWPTPVAEDTHRSVEAHLAMKQDMPGGPRNTITSLSVAVKDATSEQPVMMWPTPTVQDGANNAGPSQWQRNSDPLNVAVQRVQLYPKPTVQQGRNETSGRTNPDSQHHAGTTLNDVAYKQGLGQKLNPDFVERLMGFPDSWTVLSDGSDADGSTKSR